MRARTSSRYVEYLPHIMKRYNDSPHQALNGMTPQQVYRDKSKSRKMKSILLQRMLNPVTFTKVILQQGTIVRIAKIKNIFEKASLRGWTNEKFIINKVFITDPVTYELNDLKGEKIQGIFYREELQVFK